MNIFLQKKKKLTNSVEVKKSPLIPQTYDNSLPRSVYQSLGVLSLLLCGEDCCVVFSYVGSYSLYCTTCFSHLTFCLGPISTSGYGVGTILLYGCTIVYARTVLLMSILVVPNLSTSK